MQKNAVLLKIFLVENERLVHQSKAAEHKRRAKKREHANMLLNAGISTGISTGIAAGLFALAFVPVVGAAVALVGLPIAAGLTTGAVKASIDQSEEEKKANECETKKQECGYHLATKRKTYRQKQRSIRNKNRDLSSKQLKIGMYYRLDPFCNGGRVAIN